MATETFASDFIADLTEQIVRLIAALPPASTTYRRADLRHALQRALYFEFANDEACRRDWRSGRLAGDWLAQRVANQLRRRRTLATALGPPRFVRDTLLGRHFRRRDAARPSAVGRSPLILAVAHEKFARYLEAIRLQHDDVRYYCGTLEPLRARLEAANLPTAVPPALSPWRRLFDVRQPYLELFALQPQLDANLAFLERERPRAVVIVEGNAPFDELVNQACKLTGTPCVCIQQGWSPIIHAAFRDFSFTRMLVWGDGFGRLLQPYSPRQPFVVTGSHVSGPDSTSAATELERPAISFFLQGRSPMIDEAAWDGFLDLARRVAASLPRTPVLVREHPSSPLDESTRESFGRLCNVTVIAPSTVPLREQLFRSRVGVSLFSTTLFECVACGVVPVAVNPHILRDIVPSLAETGVGVEATTWDEATAAITRLSTDDGFRAEHLGRASEFRRSFFAGASIEQARAALQAELRRF